MTNLNFIRNLTLVWIFIIIPIKSDTPCDKGCLSCKPKSSSSRLLEAKFLSTPRMLQNVSYECRLCDMSLQYFPENGKCAIKTKENCIMLGMDKLTCLVCQKDYIWNTDLNKCQEIPVSKKIDNCFSYDHSLNCVNCDQDFFFSSSSGKCSAVTAKITGCLVYEDANNCSFCDLGYMLERFNGASEKAVCKSESDSSSDTDTATEGNEQTAPKDPVPCKIKSYFECDKCETNYFLDFNYRHKLDYKIEKNYLDLIATDLKSRLGIFKGSLFTTAMSTELKAQYDSSPFDLGVYSPCIKGLIDNCSVFETFDNCLTCNDGFYRISDGSCVKQPAAPITNCAEYTSSTVCKNCKNGYYLGPGGSTCVEVTNVENCSKYEGVSNKCIECNSKTLYVNTSTNACSTRTNYPITNCSTFQFLLDECLTCESGFLISTTKISCLQIPTNCGVYSEVSNSVTCTGCVSGYYLSGNECIKGSLNSCEVYDQTKTNVCVDCAFKFFLNDSSSCTNFSKALESDCIDTGTGDNECTKCQNDKFAVTRPKRCVQIESSTGSVGCASFDADEKCIECKDHYFGTNCQFKNEDTAIGCTKFSNNSDTVTDSTCLVCTRNSHYFSNDKCVSRHSLSLKNCLISQLDENECQLCKTEAAPRLAKKLSTCVATSSITISANLLSNCEIYDLDTEKCQVCKDTFYMSENSECVSDCPSGKIKVNGLYEEIDKESLYFGNKCVSLPSYLENCESIQVQPPNNLVCSQCKTGYKLGYDSFSGAGYTGTISSHNYNSTSSAFDSKSTFTSLGCVDETLTKGTKSDSSNIFAMENCEIFNVNNNFLYCSKCVFGKVGIVMKDAFKNKSLGTCSSSSDFDETFKYESISYALTTGATFPLTHGLDSLFSVHKCSDPTKIVFAIAQLKKTTTNSKLVLDVTDLTSKPAKSDSLTTSSSFNQICDVKTKLQGEDVSNCILGVIDMDITTDNRYFCVACAPGYRAEKFEANGVYIKKCSLITNCSSTSTSKFANTCQTCSTGAWTYSSTTSRVLFDQCSSTAIPNCLLNDLLNNSLCSVCKKGYFLSIDKTKCMNQTEENCLQKGSDFLFNVDPGK